MSLHPNYNQNSPVIIQGVETDISYAGHRSLSDDLKYCKCLITYDSNTAVETVLNGRVAVEYGKSMAHPVAMKWKEFVKNNGFVTQPSEEKLREWCHWIAYQQWTRDEMAEGETWEYLSRWLS